MRKKFVILLKQAWIVLVFVFAIRYLFQNYYKIALIFDRISSTNLILAFLFIFVSKIFLAKYVQMVLAYFNYPFSYRKSFDYYNLSQLAKYIPGSVWQFVSRVVYYKKENVPSKKISQILIFEVFFLLLAALFISILLLPFYISVPASAYRELAAYRYYYIFAFLLAAFTIIILFLILKKKNIFQKLLQLFLLGRVKQFLLILLIILLIWLSLGLSTYFLMKGFELKNTSILYCTALFAFSYFVGFLIPIAPAGIGIREAVLVFLSAGYVLSQDMLVIASLHRILYIVIEITLTLIILIWKKKENIRYRA